VEGEKKGTLSFRIGGGKEKKKSRGRLEFERRRRKTGKKEQAIGLVGVHLKENEDLLSYV